MRKLRPWISPCPIKKPRITLAQRFKRENLISLGDGLRASSAKLEDSMLEFTDRSAVAGNTLYNFQQALAQECSDGL